MNTTTLVQDLMSILIMLIALIVVIWGTVAAYKGRGHPKFRSLDFMYIAIGVVWFALYLWRLIADADNETVITVGAWAYRPSILLTLTVIAADRIYRANGTFVHWLNNIITKLVQRQ